MQNFHARSLHMIFACEIYYTLQNMVCKMISIEILDFNWIFFFDLCLGFCLPYSRKILKELSYSQSLLKVISHAYNYHNFPEI